MTGTPDILFICTGNFYRSRYAEIMFNHFAVAENLPWKAFSRGFLPCNRPTPISGHARLALGKAGIPLIGAFRFPLQVNNLDFAKASQIVVMYHSEHFPMMQSYYPEWLNKVTFWQVPDIDIMEPTKALPLIEKEVKDLIAQLDLNQQQYGT